LLFPKFSSPRNCKTLLGPPVLLLVYPAIKFNFENALIAFFFLLSCFFYTNVFIPSVSRFSLGFQCCERCIVPLWSKWKCYGGTSVVVDLIVNEDTSEVRRHYFFCLCNIRIKESVSYIKLTDWWIRKFYYKSYGLVNSYELYGF